MSEEKGYRPQRLHAEAPGKKCGWHDHCTHDCGTCILGMLEWFCYIVELTALVVLKVYMQILLPGHAKHNVSKVRACALHYNIIISRHL